MVHVTRHLLLGCVFVGLVSVTATTWGATTEPVAWTNDVNLTVTDSSIEKTAGCDGCDDAGAVSAQQIIGGDGYVEFMVPLVTKTMAAGLSHDDTDQSRGDIDFALRFVPSTFQNVVWTHLVNVTATGNSIEKTAGCNGCDDAGAASTQKIIEGDGYVEFTIPATTKTVSAGLSHRDPDAHRATIAFALRFVAGGVVEVRESGVAQAQTTFVAGDVFRVAVTGGQVTYSKKRDRKNVVFYTSAILPVYPLRLDTSLEDLNARVDNAVIAGTLSVGVVEVRENDVLQAQTTFEERDIFRVAIVGGQVKYLKKGVAFYTSAKRPDYPLLLDTSLEDLNARFVNAVISGDLMPSTGCPEPAPLAPFAGTTEFNNTVRGQMWIHDNVWWGAFSDASTGIYFYKLEGDRWVKGDLIDRNFAAGKPDTVFNGANLFILVYQSGSLARLYKYSSTWPSQTFSLDANFPVDLPLAGKATVIALAQDSTGRLWATYTSGRDVHVIWSIWASSPELDYTVWDTNGVVLASDVADFTTEAAALVSFGPGAIGVVWGNQALKEIAFRFHNDSDDPDVGWSEKEIVDCCADVGSVADDHQSLRAAPDGRLFLIAKDSIDKGHIHLYIRDVDGTWGQKTVLHPDPNAEPTRPVLLLDVENQHAYVIYKNSVDDGRIYFRRSPMDGPSFDTFCVFLEPPFSASGSPTNPTSTKENVNGITDLVAAVSRKGQIYSARLDLPSSTDPGSFRASSQSVVTETSTGSESLVTATSAWAESLVTVTTASLESLVTATVGRAWAMAGTSPAEFEVIWDGRLSSSRVPADDSQWAWLRARGVNTIVSLDDTMADVGKYGFESFLWVPLGAGVPSTEVEAERFLRFIQRRDNQPAHISGSGDRRAVMVALARYAIDGWTIESALAEAQGLNGGAPLASRQVEWLLAWAASHRPGSHRSSLGSTPDPTPSEATSTVTSTTMSAGSTLATDDLAL